MPKTINGLWDQIISFENLYAAFQGAAKGKRYQHSVMHYALNLEENLINLQNHLIWRSWVPGAQREFVVLEPKRRVIQAPPFEDRIVHHALVRVIEPLFEPRFIHDSYACRKNKGTQKSVNQAQRFIRMARREWGDDVYILKADISRYFASILHTVLMREVRRVIADQDALWLLETILAAYGHENGLGLPVGALTSQLSANIVLNRLDHVAKDDMGLRYYLRYMDDFVVVLPNKAAAQSVLADLADVVHCMNLELNPKTAIHPWQRGLDFCGYRIWPTHILPRKRNIKRARKDFQVLAKRYADGRITLPEVHQRVASFLAYAKHCEAHDTVEKILVDFVLYLPEVCKAE